MSGGSNRSHNRRNPPDLTRFSDNEPYSSTSSDDLGPDLEKSFLAASSEESSVVSTRRKLQRRRRQGSQTVGRLITPPLESSESNQGQSASMVTPRRRTSASRGSRSAPVSMRERMPMSTRTTSAYGIGPIPFQDTSNARPDRQSSRTPRKQRASGMRGQGTLISPPQSPRREREMTPATVFTNLSDEQSTRSGSSRVLGAFVGFATEVVATTLKIVRKPLGVIVALYILIVIMSSAGNYIADTVFAVLSPLCYIPGVAALNIIPYCKYVMVDSEGDETRAGKGRKHRLWTGRYVAPDYPQLINLQSEFEEILGHSAMGYALALSMKNAEISIRDLSTLVRVSKLICKDELSLRLNEFIEASKGASRELTRYGARVDGVVDSLLAMDEYALRSLESLKEENARIHSPIVSWATTPFRWRAHIDTEKKIAETFLLAASTTDNKIQKLILETEVLQRKLQGMDQTLSSINEMVMREDSNIKGQHEEVLAELWSILGGNKKKLNNFESHRELLSNIRLYRAEALKHISRTLVQLYQMAASLEDLREKVAEPSLLDATIGMELPLEVHIDSIRKGVERLNAGRLTARRFEDEYTKRLLSSKDIAQARHQVREIGHEDERKRSIQDKEFAMVAN